MFLHKKHDILYEGGTFYGWKENDYNRAEMIKIIHEWTELTQAEFGKRIGKSRTTIQAYERNLFNYQIDTLFKILDEFHLKMIIRKK